MSSIVTERGDGKGGVHSANELLLVLEHSVLDGNPTHFCPGRHLAVSFGLSVRCGEFRPRTARGSEGGYRRCGRFGGSVPN